MTGAEFLELMKQNMTDKILAGETRKGRFYATGISALANEIGCSSSQVYILKRQGVLDTAIVSRIGRKIVFDVEKARELANDFTIIQREGKTEQ